MNMENHILAQAFRELEKLTIAKKNVEVCRLCLVDGLNNGEIAERLHIPAGDVAVAKSRYLHVICEIVRRLVREDYEDPRAC